MNLHKLTILLLIAVASFGTQSCKRQKRKSKGIQTTQTTPLEVPAKIDTATQEPVKKESASTSIEKSKTEEVKVVASIKPIDFGWMSGKSKVNIKAEKMDQNVTVSIRMKKDSLIWLSAGLMGLEGVRAVIMQDSIKVLDRLNKSVYFMDFGTLSKQFNFPLGFNTVQAILIGEMPFKPSEMDQILTDSDQSIIIRQDKGRVKLDNKIRIERLEKINMTEEQGNAMTIDYADFQEVSSTANVPFLISILISYLKDGQATQSEISINHQKMEIQAEPLSFPFTVPNNYKKK